jgi:SAM-dependent methyltransferase
MGNDLTLEKQWNLVAHDFAAFCGRWPRYKVLSDIGVTNIGDLTGQSVLDVGCGVGDSTSILLAGVGPKGFVTAVDFSAECLNYARGRLKAPNVEFICGDANELLKIVRSKLRYNLIFCNAVIWQIRPLRELFRTFRLLADGQADLSFNWCDSLTPLFDGERSGEWFPRDLRMSFNAPSEGTPLAALKNELLKEGWQVRRVFSESVVETVGEEIEFRSLLSLAGRSYIRPIGRKSMNRWVGRPTGRPRVREWMYVISRKIDGMPNK